MTVAVCLQCGELKHGAFIPCPRCGYAPDDDESLTKHLLVTDHYHNRESLEAISASVKAGEPINFDRQSLEAAWVCKAELDAATKQAGYGCVIVLAIVALIIGVLMYLIV